MSKEIDKNGGSFVSPGDKLGVIEEFIPGSGTYIENGNIYSSIAGQLFLNKGSREISIIIKTNSPLIPKQGDIVIGKATNVQEKTLTLKILQIGDTQLSTSFTGVMHVSDVSHRYVKAISNLFRPGDYVRARVISTTNREFHLSTQNNDLGVIQAFCVHCGDSLVREGNRLKCTKCNKIDRRKITVDYGKN